MNKKKTILLVDDDSYFRFALATELRSDGYLVVCAENGERAIRMIQENTEPGLRVDLVITDLVMPRKDGLIFCNELKEIDNKTPVLVITGFMSDDIKQKLEKLGCKEYLEKPFSPAELLVKVDTLINESLEFLSRADEPKYC